MIDGGPMFKRYRAGSMGRAMMIRHRTSHIIIELDINKKVDEVPVQPPKKRTLLKPKAPQPQLKHTEHKSPAKAKVKKLATARRGK
jgi:hypothetical protein